MGKGRLVVATWIVALVALAACTHPKGGAGPIPRERSDDNEVLRYLGGAERQSETDEQRQEIKRALQDLLTLSPSVLARRRYADYSMTPGKWTLSYLLMRYYVPRTPPDGIAGDEKLFQDAQDPRAKEVIREHLRDLEAALQPTAR